MAKYCALIRQTWFESARAHLTDMERLAFYEACFIYEFTGEIPTAKTCKYSSVLLMFDMVKDDLEKDREKAEAIAERNRINGRAGGRPRNTTEHNKEDKTQWVNLETQKNPAETQPNPIHYTTLHNTTNAASSSGGSGGGLGLDFFNAQLWPKLNRSGKFNTRHKACCARWLEYSERKKAAITKAVISDIFVGADNPYYYLEDFAEPAPHYLSGKECEEEWKAGRSVFLVQSPQGKFEKVTWEDLKVFELTPVQEMKPAG